MKRNERVSSSRLKHRFLKYSLSRATIGYQQSWKMKMQRMKMKEPQSLVSLLRILKIAIKRKGALGYNSSQLAIRRRRR